MILSWLDAENEPRSDDRKLIVSFLAKKGPAKDKVSEADFRELP
jgi:hypothetical protein